MKTIKRSIWCGRPRKRGAFAALLLAVVAGGLCGCVEREEGRPLAAAVVIGNHANAQLPNLDSPELLGLIEQAAASCGYVSAVAVDGAPALAGAVQVKQPPAGLSALKLEQIAQEQAAAIVGGLKAVIADDAEVDTLAALHIAVRSLSSAPAGSARHIVVIDSGLCTAGLLDLRDGELLWSAPPALADWLQLQAALPDFSDTAITWMGLGDVAQPQAALSALEREQLRELWRAVITRGGGTVTFLDTLQGEAAPAQDYPAVSPVALTAQAPDRPAAFTPIVLGKEQVEFIGDTAQYKYPAAARQVLQPIAAHLCERPALSLLLAGTTASGDRDNCRALSRQRAAAVKATLVELGVPEAQIHTIGLGYENPWHTDGDRDAAGNHIEEIARRNRKVVLLDLQSAEAQTILDDGGRKTE